MTRRILSLVAVLAVAALVASAQPVAAADAGLEIASENTTDTELSSATALNNISIQGAGTSATAALSTGGNYNPVDDEGDGQTNFGKAFVGDGNFDERFSSDVRIEPSVSGTITELTPVIESTTGADFGFTVDVYIIKEQPDGTADEGTLIKSGYDPDFATGPQTIQLDQTITVDAGTTYSVGFTTSSTDNDATADALQIGVDSAASSTWFYGVGAQDNYANLGVNIKRDVSGTYIGAPHDAQQTEQLFADLSLQNASATVTAQADPDADGTFTNVTSTTVSTSQNVTLDVSTTDSARWRTRVDFSPQSGATTAELDSEGVLFQAGAPSGEGAAPTDQITSYDGDVSLNVSDADFGLAQGDSVTVTATNATGGQIGQTTVASNQTVSFSYAAKAGQNDITWTVNDSYGESATVSQSFTTPAVLSVYNESDPDQLITGTQNEITVSFYGQADSVFQRTTTDGTVNLSGLPAAPEDGYEITVTDGDDYRSRRVVVDSLFEQQAVYLLPTSATFYNVRFQLQDFTGGNFEPEDTQLYVEGPITKDFDGDGNTSTRYQTILASSFDVGSGFPTELIAEKRYRLRIVNDRGDSRIIGSYTPSEDTVEPITIKGLEFNPPEGQGWETTLETTSPTSDAGRTLTWKYKDPSGKTSRLNVSVTNESGAVVYQDTAQNGVQNYSVYDLQLANDSDYTLAWNATRGGEQIGQTRPVGGTGPLIAIPFDPDWLGTLGMLGVVFVLSLADRQKTTYVAMSAVAMAGIMMAIQAVTIFEPLWFLAALLAVGSHLRTMQQPEL